MGQVRLACEDVDPAVRERLGHNLRIGLQFGRAVGAHQQQPRCLDPRLRRRDGRLPMVSRRRRADPVVGGRPLTSASTWTVDGSRPAGPDKARW
jgi:hypothetical protein